MKVTVHELSKHFGIGERRIEQLCKAGILPKISRGKFDLIDCITRRYIRHLKQWKSEAKIPASTNNLAQCFQVSPSTIRLLAKTGVLPKIGHGRFDLIACVRAYVEHMKNNGQLPMELR
jgi:hypothetical protein